MNRPVTDPTAIAGRAMIRNVPFDHLTPGLTATLARRVTDEDLLLFAHAAGGAGLLLPGPVDLDDDGKPDRAAPAAWMFSLIATLLNTRLPGPGTVIRRIALDRHAIARVGDTVRVEVRCIATGPAPGARFAVTASTEAGAALMSGTIDLDAPTRLVEVAGLEPPSVLVDTHHLFTDLIARARRLPALTTALVCPDERTALAGALDAAAAGLIAPVLVGDRARVAQVAAQAGLAIDGLPFVDVPDAPEAAARAVSMARDGAVAAIMKGNLHSDTLLAEIVKKDAGLRGSRRLSHVFALDVPTLSHLLFVTDAAINIAPDLPTKVDIVQNAIDLARACGLQKPKVGILSAVETVTPAIPSTIDAAVLAKMADRGQITGGLVDGPLAMDNAMDMEAARTKGIASLVAGRADVLVVPNIETGNVLAKELIFVGRAQAAALVTGARVPVILTSRADDARTRLASCAMAQLYAFFRAQGRAMTDADGVAPSCG